MNRLKKFIEQGAHGEKSGRVAYAFGLELLPQANNGMDWQTVSSFSAADDLLKDPSLKDVFKATLENGHAIIDRRLS